MVCPECGVRVAAPVVCHADNSPWSRRRFMEWWKCDAGHKWMVVRTATGIMGGSYAETTETMAGWNPDAL